MRVFLVDPTKGTLVPDEGTWDLKALQEYVGGYVEPVYLDKTNMVLVDENGIFKTQTHGFQIWGLPTLLGKGVVVGSVLNEDGDSVWSSTTLELESARSSFRSVVLRS